MLLILLGSVFVYVYYLKEKKSSWIQLSEGFALNVSKKALNSAIKDQADARDPNYSLFSA